MPPTGIQKEQNPEGRYIERLEARFEKKGKSTKADRKALLENELFKLSESVRSLERYSKSSTTD